MAFAVISYLHLPLHSHLDPSPTEHFLLSSWNTHAILIQQNHDEALLLHLFLFNLFPPHSSNFASFYDESQTPVNPHEPGSFILKKHR